MPSTLDIKISNYENFENYIQISDLFFPENSKNQMTVVVLRPWIVNSGLNEFVVQILLSNEFNILKRKNRILTKAECTYLMKEEAIPEDSAHLYYEIMMSGPVEILGLSKIGAVSDAKTLFNGANPYGRRRMNQLDQQEGQQMRNTNALNQMMGIAPFTSFNELIDLSDFLARSSSLSKYKKLLDKTKAANQAFVHTEREQTNE